jgi:hypothetical protein
MRPGFFAGAGTPFQNYQATGYDRQPYACYSAGLNQLQAAAAGVMMGVFGWADPGSGLVSNGYSAGQQLGFVLPTFNGWNWQRAYWYDANDPDDTPDITSPVSGMILRGGMPVVLAVQGDFYTPFPNGATAGARVWADPVYGLAYCADGGGYIQTPWVCMQNRSGGCAARISSFATSFN